MTAVVADARTGTALKEGQAVGAMYGARAFGVVNAIGSATAMVGWSFVHTARPPTDNMATTNTTPVAMTSGVEACRFLDCLSLN
jgi:hypothetical protein